VLGAPSGTDLDPNNPFTGAGVFGLADDGIGVGGTSSTGPGMRGHSTTGPGFVGHSVSGPGVLGAPSGTDLDPNNPFTGAGVFGLADDGIGVGGTSSTGPGLHGRSTTGPGVFGQSTGGFGVHGASTAENCAGVVGVADGVDSDAGVYGVGSVGRAVGVRAAGAGANLRLDPAGPPPPTRNDPHDVGQLIIDSNGDLWLCITTGTPGAYRKVAGLSTAGAFHPLAAPVRVYDSRPGDPPANVTKGQLANGSTRVLDAKNNASGVPPGATAIIVNLTVTQTSPQGFLALYRNGIAWPGTSSINWDHAGQTIANMAVVALDSNARFQAYVNLNSACDVLVDVVGYWR
jgi:hypothetical protein